MKSDENINPDAYQKRFLRYMKRCVVSGKIREENDLSRVLVDVGVTPALRRRRERAERQRSFIREQQEATANMRASVGHSDDQESE